MLYVGIHKRHSKEQRIAAILLLLNNFIPLAHAKDKLTDKPTNDYQREDAGASVDTKKTRLAFDERLSYNSENQFSSSLTGLYGFTPEIFTVATLHYSFYKTNVPPAVERNYAGTIQGGYNNGLWGLDASYTRGTTKVAKLNTQGIGVGATFAYIPGMLGGKSSDERLDLMKVSNLQTYQTRMNGEETALFWARAGIVSNTLNSNLITGETETSRDGIRQLGFTLDAYYPIEKIHVLSAGIMTYSYNKNPGTFSTELFQNTNENVFLVGSTVLGLPAFHGYMEFTWQVTPLDAFMPRVSTTHINATTQWEVGGALTWRRQLMKGLYITPSYDLTVLGSVKVSGVTLSLFQEI